VSSSSAVAVFDVFILMFGVRAADPVENPPEA
jgi:hypothetical protein